MITASRVLLLSLLLVCAPSLTAATTLVPANYAAAIADARRAWNADSKELADLIRRMANASSEAARVQESLNDTRKALDELKDERAAALDDLRSGAFCTGCGRTRSDLLAHGESFPHPGQRSRPATPEELEKAERDFDTRMAGLRQKISRLEVELKNAEADLMAAYHHFLSRFPDYHRHLAQEQENRLGKWLDEKLAAETELKALQEAVTAKAKDPLQLTQRLTSAKYAEDRARTEERVFRRDVLGNIDYLAGLAKPIPNRHGVNGAYIGTVLRNPPVPVGYTVPGIYVGPPLTNAGTSTGSGTPSDLQQLLDGPAQPKAGGAKPPTNGDKSVQDLLNGK